MGVARRTVRQSATSPLGSTVPEVNDLQRQVADLQRQFNPFASGVLLQWTAKSGAQTLQHRLGRVPVGVIDLGRFVSTGGGYPVVVVDKDRTDASHITLVLSGLCDGKVWVF